MAARRKRRESWGTFAADPGEGLEINNIIDTRLVSRRSRDISLFDADNIAVEFRTPNGRRSYKRVSVMGGVRHINVSKDLLLNGYKERIRGR